MRGKGRKRKLEMTMKERERPKRRNKDRDRLSDLPDSVLLYIMKFLDTKQAIQTCVLSKRWRNLCKHVTNLTYEEEECSRGFERFRKFSSWVVSNRDDSSSLFDLNINIWGWADPRALNRIIKYAVCHNVQHLKIKMLCLNFDELSLLIRSHSLTSLTLHNVGPTRVTSLHFPSLKIMRLYHVEFGASHNDCAQPFSNCSVLETLTILYFCLHKDAKVLHISNSTLSCLTLHASYFYFKPYQILLSTPKLGSFTVKGRFCGGQPSSTCNLYHVGQVYIDIIHAAKSVIMKWLHLFTNVKVLTFSLDNLRQMLWDLSDPNPNSPQPPCFVRLESLKVERNPFTAIFKKEMNTVMKYLLQNSPMAKVDAIQNC